MVTLGPASRSLLLRSFVVVAVLTGAIGVAGCSLEAHSTVSASSVETRIASELASRLHIPPPAVHCPGAVPARVGARFTCTAVIDGQVLRVVGTVTGTQGEVEVHPSDAVIMASKAEAEIGKSLSARLGRRVPVSCAVPPVLVAPVGHSFECTANIAGASRRIVVTVVNPAGELSYRVLPFGSPASTRQATFAWLHKSNPGAPTGSLPAATTQEVPVQTSNREKSAKLESYAVASARRRRSRSVAARRSALPPVAAFTLPMKKPVNLSSPPA
jgi:Domain of unknown function (DUF4333)